MPNTESGLTGPGIEPKPEVETIDSDKGFARALREQPGGDSLPASAREMGAPNSPHRKAWVQDKFDESQRLVDQQIRSKEEFDNYIIGPSAGDVRGGFEFPDDSPAPAPAAPSPEATEELEAVKAQLVTTRASLTEAQTHEALQVARDSLEESMDETDVHNTLSILKSELSRDEFAGFVLESVGDGLLDPDELETFNEVWESERAFEDAFDRSAADQAAADALLAAQLETLEGEQRRLGLNDAEYTLHVADMAEASRQLGMDWDRVAKEAYPDEIRKLSALVAETRRAWKAAALQEQIINGSSTNVESGLTVMGVPVQPREEIEPVLDFGRMLTHSNIGKPFNIAKGVMEADRQARSKGEDIEKAFRAARRAQDEKEARASKSMGL